MGANLFVGAAMMRPVKGHIRLPAGPQPEAARFPFLGPVGLAAVRVDPAQQPLGNDPDQGCRFTEATGKGVDAEINHPVAVFAANATVLGLAQFGNIEIRQG